MTSEELRLEGKKFWATRDQKLWDETKLKTNQELLDIIQSYWSDLSGDNEFYFPIQLLRQRLGVKVDEEYFGSTYKEYKNDGYPDNEITERKL
uniref:ORF18 n=1 Tax=Nitrosopumilaceae spindle-shaped virus TaxID=3065433 RepID=A0AAT9J737_9VIRU